MGEMSAVERAVEAQKCRRGSGEAVLPGAAGRYRNQWVKLDISQRGACPNRLPQFRQQIQPW
jgi:hypothetical protein